MARGWRFLFERVFRRAKLDRETEDEFRFHLEARTIDLERAGMPHDEAERRARVEFGGRVRFQEECRDARWASAIHRVLWDVRYAARNLRKSPGFTAVAVLTLGLGIGANTAIFSIADAVLIRRLPYPDANRLTMVWEVEGKFDTAPVTAPDYEEWKRQQAVFEEMGAGTEAHPALTGAGVARQIDGLAVTPEPLRMLGARPQLGRLFTAGDMGEGHDRVVILGYALWQQAFGGDPDIVGKTVHLDRMPYTVIGVLPADFRAPRIWTPDPQLWVPVRFYGEAAQSPGSHWLWVMGRMKPDVTVAQARTAMRAIAAGIREREPATHQDLDANVVPLRDYLVTEVRDVLAMLLGAVAFILAIACANIANLLMAQAVRRRAEIAVRKALGASTRRLFAQLLTESLVLSLLGAAAGLALGVGLKGLLVSVAPMGYFPSFNLPEFNLRIFGFAALLSLLTGAVFGTFPALEARRSRAVEVLNGAGRSIVGGGKRLRQSLVVIEIASAMVLLFAAGIAIHSLYRLVRQDLGFNATHLITGSIALPAEHYPDSKKAAEFFRQLQERVRALPGVTGAELASELPLQGFHNGIIWVEGRPEPRGLGGPLVANAYVTAGYLEMMGISVVRGRGFTKADGESKREIAIVNETMARRFWAGGDAVGKRFSFQWGNGKPNWIEIVGVVRDIRQYGLRTSPYPGIYIPLPADQAPGQMSLVVRSSGGDESMAKSLAAVVRDIDPDLPLNQVQPMAEAVAKSAAPTRFNSTIFALLGSLALSLAGAGVFGVMSYLVAQRTHEIGIRVALGASAVQLIREVLAEAVGMTLAGVALGTIGAVFAGRSLRAISFQIGPYDPVAFGGSIFVLVVCGILAAYLPARRASRVDPMNALRYE